ncbi:MAG: hypothetical protein Q9P01_17630 [Anaerolineae bacterium]|nr:hypothetical protein [Anaerolineae bacterium]
MIEQSLAKEVNERYQSSGNLAIDLEKALANEALESDSASAEQETLEALLMTNMLGHAIFVDTQCLHLLRRHHNEARAIIGKPLATVLGCDADVAAQLMQDINTLGKVDDQPLEITDARGKKHTVNCSAIATRDDDGKFVGADIKLTLIPDVSAAPSETFSTVQEAMNTREETFLQAYFVTQIDALYELLMNWAGPKVAKNLEDILTETGQRNVWTVSMSDGHITVQLKHTDTAVYQALLARAMTYAASIIGTGQVVSELEYINKSTDPAVLKFVQTLGLDQLYKDILN